MGTMIFTSQNNIGILKAKRSSEIDWSSLTINWGGLDSETDKKEFNEGYLINENFELITISWTSDYKWARHTD